MELSEYKMRKIVREELEAMFDDQIMPALMTPEEVGEVLSVQTGTLDQWRAAGKGPEYTKIGGAVRYFKEDVVKFINEKRSNPTGSKH